MGGSAFDNIEISRLNINTYTCLKNKIISVLQNNGIICTHVIEAPEKDSYGDIDIIYISGTYILNFIKSEFNIIDSISNSVISSVAINYENNNYQVDFIKSSLEEYEIHKFYLSYGDMGNIIGRMTNANGIKFGINGLYLYYYPNGDTSIATFKLHLSTNPFEICDFLNLNYDQYVNGFETLNDIFNWIIKCKYFNKKLFNNDNLNTKYKHRIQTRKMFNHFIEFINTIQINEINEPKDKKTYIIDAQLEAIQYFNKIDILNNEIELLQKKNIIKSKFNGKLFIDRGINPRLINNYIEQFQISIKNKYNKPFDIYIIETSQDKIISELNNFISNK